MGVCGKRVVASMTHWCGPAGARSTKIIDKCGAKKNGKKAFVGTVLKSKGSDLDLLKTLTKLESLHSDHEDLVWKKKRVEKERKYLKACLGK